MTPPPHPPALSTPRMVSHQDGSLLIRREGSCRVWPQKIYGVGIVKLHGEIKHARCRPWVQDDVFLQGATAPAAKKSGDQQKSGDQPSTFI